jgi:hypothetical protein
MPYMKNGKRDYKTEYEKYAGETKAKKDRAQRNKARRIMTKAGKAKKGDGKDVGHVRAISKGGLSQVYNLQMQSKSENRSFSKTKDSKMKSERSKRESAKRGGDRRTGR